MSVWIITDNDYYFNMYGIFSTKELAEKAIKFMSEKETWKHHTEEIKLDELDWQYSIGKVIGNTYKMFSKKEVQQQFKGWLENEI